MQLVLVNGQIAVENGRVTDVLAGRALTRAGGSSAP
jgi:hypothetical protein